MFVSFLPISILAYTLNAGAIVVDKVLLKKSLPNPLSYTFYVSLLQLLALLLIPFGFVLSFDKPFYLAALSGLISVFALYALFTSLKLTEASVAGPLIGALNPFFALILEVFILKQPLTTTQSLAVIILIAGTVILTLNQWFGKLQDKKPLYWMITAGFLFGLSYVLLRQAYLDTSFINGLVVSRTTAGLLALSLLILPLSRKQVFTKQKENSLSSKSTIILMLFGQTMGAGSGLLLAFGVSLASAALVNSLFGVQYLVILVAAILLAKKHPQLLEEKLSRPVIIQKFTGVAIISFGLYLLAK